MPVQLYKVKKSHDGILAGHKVQHGISSRGVAGFVADVEEDKILICLFKTADSVSGVEVIKESLTQEEVKELFNKALEKNPEMADRWLETDTGF